MKHCKKCKGTNSNRRRVCFFCGHRLSPKLKRRPPALDAKIRKAARLFDEWMTALKVATQKVAYYARLHDRLERERASGTQTRSQADRLINVKG